MRISHGALVFGLAVAAALPLASASAQSTGTVTTATTMTAAGTAGEETASAGSSVSHDQRWEAPLGLAPVPPETFINGDGQVVDPVTGASLPGQSDRGE